MNADFQRMLDEIKARSKKAKAPGGSKKTCDGQTNTKSIRGTYQMTPEELETHKNEILSIEAARRRCIGCTGQNCLQSPRGMRPAVTPYGGRFYSSLEICRHEEARRQQRRIERLFQSARVPAAYAADSFDTYEHTPDNAKAVAAAKWLTSTTTESRGLFIYGPRGTGKTKLAAIIANEKAKAGQPVLFSSVPDLLEDIRQSYGTNTTAETVKAARESPCLILDDLGAEHITEWVGEQLFTLLNYRYNNKLQTIITTNYSTGELVNRLTIYTKAGEADDTQAQRILSRIYGMCVRVYLGGRDWRQKGGDRNYA